MAKRSSGGMHKGGGTKARGRTAGASSAAFDRSPTKPNTPISMRTEATRPGSAGVKKRGDRRDTNPQFTGSNRHQQNNGDPMGSGKKQTQGGGKALKGGGKKRR